jgi:SRSO17 transposase
MIQGSSVSPDAGSEIRFQAYVTEVSEVIGHADRVGPLRGYCTGLLLPGGRKSIEPMAARLDPRHNPPVAAPPRCQSAVGRSGGA